MISSGVTGIGKTAFEGCSALASVTIPESVKRIGDSAFSKCTALTSVTLPEGVTSIGDYAFYKCTALSSVTLPESVTGMGCYTFRKCSSLTSVTIPAGVTTIDYEAFCECSSLATVTISEGVQIIGERAFMDCTALTSVTIPGSVTSIYIAAFYHCSALASVTIPDSVTHLGQYAFGVCSSLTSFRIPEGITSIEDKFFWNCSSLTSVTIPESVTSIDDEAFYGCSALAHVYYGGSKEQWDAFSFELDNYPLWVAEIHYNYVPFTVTVSADPAEGGTVTGGGIYASGAFATLTATPAQGWHFVCWYLNGEENSTQQSFFRPVVSDLTYVAKFEKDASGTQTRYISFSANGGSGTMNSVEVTGEYQVPDCAFTPPEGKVFDCWKVYGGSQTYRPGDVLDAPGSHIALEAQWKEASLTVSFDANGGTGTMSPVPFTDPYTIPACAFTPPEGKVFDCWKVSGSDQTCNPGETLAATGESITLQTVWKDAQSEQPPETVKRGDVDFDGEIASADARLALRRSVGLEDYPEGSPAFLACDVDYDGEVTSADARLILRASVGLEDPDAWGQT